MINLLTSINKTLKEAASTEECYFQTNPKTEINYPYIVYNYDIHSLEQFTDELTLDVDIFHNKGLDRLEIEALCAEIKRKINFKNLLTEACFIRFFYLRHHPIPTQSNVVQRSNMQIQ